MGRSERHHPRHRQHHHHHHRYYPWKYNLCECLASCRTCLLTWLLPCYTFYEVAYKVIHILRNDWFL